MIWQGPTTYEGAKIEQIQFFGQSERLPFTNRGHAASTAPRHLQFNAQRHEPTQVYERKWSISVEKIAALEVLLILSDHRTLKMPVFCKLPVLDWGEHYLLKITRSQGEIRIFLDQLT